MRVHRGAAHHATAGVDGACGVGVDAPLVRPDQLTFVVAVHAAVVRCGASLVVGDNGVVVHLAVFSAELRGAVFHHEGGEVLTEGKHVVVAAAWSSATSATCRAVQGRVQREVLCDLVIPVERGEGLVVEVPAHVELFHFAVGVGAHAAVAVPALVDAFFAEVLVVADADLDVALVVPLAGAKDGEVQLVLGAFWGVADGAEVGPTLTRGVVHVSVAGPLAQQEGRRPAVFILT